MAKHHKTEDAPVLSTLTPDGFWRLPIADRDWLSYACGVSDATAHRMIEVLDAETVRMGARTVIFPARIADKAKALAERLAAVDEAPDAS